MARKPNSADVERATIRDVAARAGVPPSTAARVVAGNYGDPGREFTAVFAATDMVAAGVLAALREAGLRISQDVSVVGYDDIPLAQDVTPALTTVHIPMEEIGRAAVRMALRPQEPQYLLLGTHIVVRGTAGLVPAARRG